MPNGEIFTGPVEDLGQRLGSLHLSGHPWRPRGQRASSWSLWMARWCRRARKRTRTICSTRSTATRARATWASSRSAPTPASRASPRAILFDEKIGGTLHMAVGAGYPETGSVNQSSVHWDFICDLRKDGEIWSTASCSIRMASFRFWELGSSEWRSAHGNGRRNGGYGIDLELWDRDRPVAARAGRMAGHADADYLVLWRRGVLPAAAADAVLERQRVAGHADRPDALAQRQPQPSAEAGLSRSAALLV